MSIQINHTKLTSLYLDELYSYHNMRTRSILQMPFLKHVLMNFILWASTLLTIWPQLINAQDTQSFFVDAAFQRFNMREFDVRLSEPNFKNRMLCENWCDSKITTEVDTADIKFNIDLSESVFYVNLNKRVLSIRNDFIRSFVIDDKKYINYLLPESSKTMILELLVEGDFALYRHHDLSYHPPNFNAVLNVGNKEGSYKKRYDYYAYCNETLIKIPSRIKKALKKLQQECQAPSIKNVKGDIIDLFKDINELEK